MLPATSMVKRVRAMKNCNNEKVHEEQRNDGAKYGRRDGVAAVAEEFGDFVV